MRSMTGYGRGKAAGEQWEVDVVIRSVNHRFLDPAIRLNREQSFLEETIRRCLAEFLKRGHVEVSLSIASTSGADTGVKVDMGVAADYLRQAAELGKLTGIPAELSMDQLLSLNGVCTLGAREMDEDAVRALTEQAMRDALKQLVDMRECEGANLRRDLKTHLELARELRESMVRVAPEAPVLFREKLTERLSAADVSAVDPQRLAQEVALMADRCAVDEELARLESHFGQMDVYLKAESDIGKKMDFLIQEMNREANTIASKSASQTLTNLVLEMKSEIEKMREQVQNVE